MLTLNVFRAQYQSYNSCYCEVYNCHQSATRDLESLRLPDRVLVTRILDQEYIDYNSDIDIRNIENQHQKCDMVYSIL